MSNHKTAPIKDESRVWSIARERGNRVRYQDSVSGRMTGWCASPAYLARRAGIVPPNGTMQRLTEQARAEEAQRAARFREVYITGYVSQLLYSRRAELVSMADRLEVKYPSKATKPQIARALAEYAAANAEPAL